jgi:hypothetical protein
MLVALGFVALATDTPTLAIILGFAGTIVTAILGAFTAISLSKKERTKTAETTLEMVLRERIVLREEEIQELREDLKQCVEERDKAIAQRDRLYMAIVEQRAEERVKNGDT